MNSPQRSYLFQVGAHFLFLFIVAFALFYFLRGHQSPGGGFIAGLYLIGAYWTLYLAFDAKKMLQVLWIAPVRLLGVGLFIAASASLFGPLSGDAFFKGLWPKTEISFLNSLGTPVLFDLGVMLVVLGLGTFWVQALEDRS